ncbi:hypothetical protein [Cellulosilyticum sp. I15G10I2]|uniref:hypothetical protein n=1 Tax=Cellulosilyticum sp. I15G10I2 TaxID=1892843 RepID=UPI0009F49C0A|nr:hypothetical protein [Cellulosilyticum sp. I15G10I2]
MDRLTEKTIGTFKYDLKGFKHKPREFNDYDAFFAYSMAVKRLGELEDDNELRPIDEWGEDYGDCLWWNLPIVEPPYCGSPLDMNFPDYVTHFTRLTYPIGIE